MQLGSRLITNDSSPYIIAEIGVNHEGSISLAKKLIELAYEGGADAAKFQTYKAHKIASKNSPSYWDINKEKTNSQFELFKKYDKFEQADYEELAAYCKKLGIDFLSTPFDLDCIDFLDDLVPFYKIASADLTNIPLLKKIAHKNKPIILSTGASDKSEIEHAINYLKKHNANEIALLHCILNYPTQDNNANLGMIRGLKLDFPNHLIGYSDHTVPDFNMNTLLTSYLLGAVILEKHFTHDKTLPGNDHYHAMDKNDLLNFKKIVTKSRLLIGNLVEKQVIPSEEVSRKNARRSLVLKKKLVSGQIIRESNIICKRPGIGISPIHWEEVIGKSISSDLPEDHILQWNDLL